MDLEQMVKTLLEGQQSLLERVARMEEKLDGLTGAQEQATRRAERLESRMEAVERVPAGRWNALTQAVLTAIGMAAGGGALAAAVHFLK